MKKGAQASSKIRKRPAPAPEAPASSEYRVLILAPSGNDARLTADFLTKAALHPQICHDVIALCEAVKQGCGAILLAEETLGHSSMSLLIETLAHRPQWSDIPVAIITSGGEASQMQLRRLSIFGPSGNVTLLERPFRPGTLISTVEAALRARRRQSEVRDSMQAIRESELRYRQVVGSLPAAVYTTDVQGRVTLYNDAAAALWGRKPEIGKELWCGSYRIYRPDGTPMPLDQCPMAVTLREGRPVRGQEIIIERPDGSRRNVLPYPDPIRGASGKIVGAVNMLLDITESKRAERATQWLAAIVASSEDAIVSKDLNGIITSWNQGAELLFGYHPGEIIGRPVTVLMPPDRWNEEPNILERIRRGERIEHYETVRQHKDGSQIEISLTVSPIKNSHGEVIGASKIIRDITAPKQARRDLERAHKEVLVASRAKDDFLAALSHELRTPLNPILLLASEAAETQELPAEIRAQFTLIRNSIELEARLIDDLLDITRIAHGKLTVKMMLVDVHAVLKEAIATVRADVDGKGITLALELVAERSMVKGDAVRLQQIFWNLLKNAVKFTPAQGKITVATRIESVTGEIVIALTDTGIGMTESDLGRIFEAFTQGENTRAVGAHPFGGLGLGLAISRMLVESHSGSIRASSAGRGQGTTLIVSLPLSTERAVARQSPEPAQPSATAPKNGHAATIRILLVEDHEPTRIALTQLLTRRHYEVKTAASLLEARALSQEHAFQLLISDIGLPDGSGLEFIKELRARHKGLRGIALTGYGMEQDIARSQEAGFTVHLTKPVRVQSLERALAEATQAASLPETPCCRQLNADRNRGSFVPKASPVLILQKLAYRSQGRHPFAECLNRHQDWDRQ